MVGKKALQNAKLIPSTRIGVYLEKNITRLATHARFGNTNVSHQSDTVHGMFGNKGKQRNSMDQKLKSYCCTNQPNTPATTGNVHDSSVTKLFGLSVTPQDERTLFLVRSFVRSALWLLASLCSGRRVLCSSLKTRSSKNPVQRYADLHVTHLTPRPAKFVCCDEIRFLCTEASACARTVV